MTRRLDLVLAEAASFLVAPAGCGLAWLTYAQGPSGAITSCGADGCLGSRWAAVTMLAMSLYCGGVIAWLAVLKRRHPQSPARALGFTAGQVACAGPVLLAALLMAWISGDFGGKIPPALIVAFAAMVPLTLGAVIGRVPPNAVVGLRNWWTRRSRHAFARANRLAGKMLMATGAATLLTDTVWSDGAVAVFFAGQVSTVVLATYESRRVWRSDPNRLTP